MANVNRFVSFLDRFDESLQIGAERVKKEFVSFVDRKVGSIRTELAELICRFGGRRSIYPQNDIINSIFDRDNPEVETVSLEEFLKQQQQTVAQNEPDQNVRPLTTGHKRKLSSRSSEATTAKRAKNYVCKQCDASFVGLSNLLNHERIHLGIKPFSCSWSNCPGYASEKYGNVILHILGIHFKLPRTIKERKEQAIADERNPNQFVTVDEQLANRRL